MLYFFLGLAAIVTCALQGVSYGWFANNQDNALHNIVDLWTKDPLERAFYVPINSDCPDGTSEENIRYGYDGRSALCVCETVKETYSDRYLKGTTSSSSKPSSDSSSTPTPSYQECSSIYCSSNQEKETKVVSISSATFHNFFVGQKLCTSRIKGYSFANKAPENYSCGGDDKYCGWTSENQSFDIHNGYCIPKDKECYVTGVQVPKQQDKDFQQLPLVGYGISITQSDSSYILNIDNLKENDLLQINDIDYSAGYESQITQTFIFQSKYMPRVQQICRKKLKDTLSHYIGPDGACSISLASLIFSTFAVVIQFCYAGIADICVFKEYEKNECQSYCEAKRFNVKHSKIRNILLVAKPIILCIMLILNIVIEKDYISMQNYINFMSEQRCVDKDVSFAIWVLSYTSSFYDTGLTYASIVLIVANLFFDQNVYYFIKTVILIIFCQQKCSSEKKKEIQNPVQTSPEIDTKKELKKDEENKIDHLKTLAEKQQHPVLNNNNNININIETNKLSSIIKNKDSVHKDIELKDTEKQNKKVKKIQKKILKLEEKLKQANLTNEQTEKNKKSIKKKTIN